MASALKYIPYAVALEQHAEVLVDVVSLDVSVDLRVVSQDVLGGGLGWHRFKSCLRLGAA